VIEERGEKRKRENDEKENIPSSKHPRSIVSLICLLEGDTFANAFEVDIEKSNTICKLKDIIKRNNAQTFAKINAKDIRLWKVKIPDNREDQLNNLSLQDKDELLATRKISKYFPSPPPEEHVHVIVKLSRKCWYSMYSSKSLLFVLFTQHVFVSSSKPGRSTVVYSAINNIFSGMY